MLGCCFFFKGQLLKIPEKTTSSGKFPLSQRNLNQVIGHQAGQGMMVVISITYWYSLHSLGDFYQILVSTAVGGKFHLTLVPTIVNEYFQTHPWNFFFLVYSVLASNQPSKLASDCNKATRRPSLVIESKAAVRVRCELTMRVSGNLLTAKPLSELSPDPQ